MRVRSVPPGVGASPSAGIPQSRLPRMGKRVSDKNNNNNNNSKTQKKNTPTNKPPSCPADRAVRRAGGTPGGQGLSSPRPLPVFPATCPSVLGEVSRRGGAHTWTFTLNPTLHVQSVRSARLTPCSCVSSPRLASCPRLASPRVLASCPRLASPRLVSSPQAARLQQREAELQQAAHAREQVHTRGLLCSVHPR